MCTNIGIESIIENLKLSDQINECVNKRICQLNKNRIIKLNFKSVWNGIKGLNKLWNNNN